MKTKLIFTTMLVALVLASCEKEDDYSPANLIDVMTLEVINNNAPADGVSEIDILAKFNLDFETETDGKVEFQVFKDSVETSLKTIVLTTENNQNIRISELSVAHNKVDSLRVKATINSNGSQVSKEQYVKFTRAYLDSINVFTDSLTIQPSSFSEIELTTELIRSIGIPNIGSIAETRVVDTLGLERGIFNNYSNQSNHLGMIKNKFTLGNDDYTGKLFVISRSETENNTILVDSLTIYSQQ